MVSSRYKVVQAAEILEFYRDLTEVGGYEQERASPPGPELTQLRDCSFDRRRSSSKYSHTRVTTSANAP